MAKKSFINDNPALRFITEAETPEEQPAPQPTPQPQPKANLKAPSRPASRSTAKTKNDEPKYKLNPAYIETKSRRVQLVMQPSLYNSIKEAAIKEDISVNEFIHKTLEDALRK